MEESEVAKPATFYGTNPVFRLADLDARLAYYVDQFGFHINWRNSAVADVARGRTSIFLSVGDQGHAESLDMDWRG